MMNKNSIVKLTKELNITDLSGEKVMVDFESGKYFLMKGSSNDIWDILTEAKDGISIENIVIRLREIYEVSEQECLNSVLSFLSQLQNLNFISCEE